MSKLELCATPSKQEHLQWCKDRALEYVEEGELLQAFSSMVGDLGRHPETIKTAGIINGLGMRLLLVGKLGTKEEMTDWINGRT